MQHSKPRLTPTIEPMVIHNIVHHENPPGEKDNIISWSRTTTLNNPHGKQET